MKWNPGEIVSRLLGGAMLFASTGFFIGMQKMDAFVIPAVLFGAGGFWLAARRARHPELSPELQQRLLQLENEVVANRHELAGTQAELAAANEEIARLVEVGDFMKQLSSGTPAAARGAEPGTTGS